MADELNGGGSTLQRLERIERMLDKLDDKLDIKADRADVHVLSARVAVLELDWVKTTTRWELLAPDLLKAEKDIAELQRLSVIARAEADKTSRDFRAQGFKLDTTGKKVAAVAGVGALLLNTLDSVVNLPWP